MQIPPFIHFDAPFLFYALTDVLTDSSSSDAHCKEGYSVLITLPQRYQFLAFQVSLLNELFPYFCERYHFYYKKDNGGEGHQEMFLVFFCQFGMGVTNEKLYFRKSLLVSKVTAYNGS